MCIPLPRTIRISVQIENVSRSTFDPLHYECLMTSAVSFLEQDACGAQLRRRGWWSSRGGVRLLRRPPEQLLPGAHTTLPTLGQRSGPHESASGVLPAFLSQRTSMTPLMWLGTREPGSLTDPSRRAKSGASLTSWRARGSLRRRPDLRL